MVKTSAVSVLQADFDLTHNNGFESGMLDPWIGFNAKVVDAPSFSGLFCAKLAANGLNAYIYQRASIFTAGVKSFQANLTKADQRPNPPISIVVYQNIPAFTDNPPFTNILVSRILPYDSLAYGVWTNVVEGFQREPITDTPAGFPPSYLVINALPTLNASPVFLDDAGILATGPG